MNQVPVSTWSPMAMAASASAVQMAAVRPYSLWFISRTASWSSETFTMPITGAKLSSVMRRMPWFTSTSTRGAM